MGRMKVGLAMAGVIVTLVGALAAVTMRQDGGSDRAETVVDTAPVDPGRPSVVTVVPIPAIPPAATSATKAPSAPPTTAAAPAPAPSASSTAPGASRAPGAPAQATVDEIQRVIAGITQQVLAPAEPTAGTKAPTKEQVEAQVREQLKQLGITY